MKTKAIKLRQLDALLHRLGSALRRQRGGLLIEVTITLAVFGVLGGGLVLLFSVFREKLFLHRRDPYRRVKR